MWSENGRWEQGGRKNSEDVVILKDRKNNIKIVLTSVSISLKEHFYTEQILCPLLLFL